MKTINRKGFTIVELVIVIAIIAILAAVLIPTFASIIKKAEESAYLQERTNQQIQDLTEKIENNNYLTWEEFEEKLAVALASLEKNPTPEQIKDAVLAAIGDKFNTTGLTEEQVRKIIDKALESQLTDAQVKAIVDAAITNLHIRDSLTEAQVKSIVQSAINALPSNVGITKDQMTKAIADAIKTVSTGLSKEDVDDAIAKALDNFKSELLTEDEVSYLVQKILDSLQPGDEPITALEIKNWADLLAFATSEETVIGTVEADIEFLKFPLKVYGTKTLDLNGHTLNLANGEYDSDYDPENGALIYIEKNALLTLNDSSGNNSGKIAFSANAPSGDEATFIFCNYGELTINGGNYMGPVASLMEYYTVSFPVALNYGNLTINGGILTQKSAMIALHDCVITNGYGINYMDEEQAKRCPVLNFNGGQLINQKTASKLILNYHVTTFGKGEGVINDSTGSLTESNIVEQDISPTIKPGATYSFDPQEYATGFESIQEYTEENNYTISIKDSAFPNKNYYWRITKSESGYTVAYLEINE